MVIIFHFCLCCFFIFLVNTEQHLRFLSQNLPELRELRVFFTCVYSNSIVDEIRFKKVKKLAFDAIEYTPSVIFDELEQLELGLSWHDTDWIKFDRQKLKILKISHDHPHIIDLHHVIQWPNLEEISFEVEKLLSDPNHLTNKLNRLKKVQIIERTKNSSIDSEKLKRVLGKEWKIISSNDEQAKSTTIIKI